MRGSIVTFASAVGEPANSARTVTTPGAIGRR